MRCGSLHHSHVLTIRDDSYRLRAKRKSGLIKPPTFNQRHEPEGGGGSSGRKGGSSGWRLTGFLTLT